MKIVLVGAELLHADGQTDMKQRIAAFLNFVKASKRGRNVECWSADVSKQ
jgi:hypothetical protein